MKNITLLSILLILTIFLSACDNTVTPTGPSFNPFIGGDVGLVAEFDEGMPPVDSGVILDKGRGSFGISLTLENVGEYDIKPEEGDLLRLELRGLLPEHYGKTANDFIIVHDSELLGARKNLGEVIPGNMINLAFEDLTYQSDIEGDHTAPFSVNLCYDYQTRATTHICLANDVTGALTDKNPPCSVKGPKDVKSSGAPLKITSVTQSPAGGSKVQVKIEFEHMGSGAIFAPESDRFCDNTLQNPDMDYVDVTVSLPSSSVANLKCSQFNGEGKEVSGRLRLLQNGPKSFVCTVESFGDESLIYEDNLNIDVSYRYGVDLQKTIIISDVP